MQEKLPAIHFYPGDWLRDNVAGCSLAAQGLWLRMMLVAHDGDSYGQLSVSGRALLPDEIARRCGCGAEEFRLLFNELERAGIPSRDPNGIIYSRRMVRDAAVRAARKRAGSLGGLRTQSFAKAKGQANVKQNYDIEGEGEIELPEVLKTEQFFNAWAKWMQYQAEKGRSPTPMTIAEQLKTLAAWGPAKAAQAIKNAIERGWTGFFEPEAVKTAKPPQKLPDAAESLETMRARDKQREAENKAKIEAFKAKGIA